jgi:hypothetical protein
MKPHRPLNKREQRIENLFCLLVILEVVVLLVFFPYTG